MTAHKVDVAVLKVLTAFAALLWLMLLPAAVAFVHHDAPEHALGAVCAMLACTSLLLVYLLSPQPQRWLQRYYLPLALVLSSLTPFVGELLSLRSGPIAYGKIYDGDQWVFDAIRAGAAGYLLKDTPAEQLIEAIRGTASGKVHLDPSVAGKGRRRPRRRPSRTPALPTQRRRSEFRPPWPLRPTRAGCCAVLRQCWVG